MNLRPARPKWRCSSCGKKLPDSQKGWGLIWDDSESGMCCKCLYDIRKAIGYFDIPIEKRRRAPKIRKRAMSRDALLLYQECSPIASEVQRRLKINRTSLILRCSPTSCAVYRHGVPSRTRLKPEENNLVIQTKVLGGDWSKGVTYTNPSKAVYDLFAPHLEGTLLKELTQIVAEAEKDALSPDTLVWSDSY